MTSSNRPSYSCIRCSVRKVRCDHQDPCSACVKHSARCEFRPLPSPRKRQRHSKVLELQNRLKECETLLQEKGINPEKIPYGKSEKSRTSLVPSDSPASERPAQILTPSSIGTVPRSTFIKTQLVQGQKGAKFVDNSLWTRVFEEFQNPEDGLEENSEDSDSEVDDFEDEHDFWFVETPRSKTRCPHPPTSHVFHLWQIFVDNVDPLTKIVHVPTLQPAIENAVADIENVPRGFEALLFSIYCIAVVSMTDNQCKHLFGESRQKLLIQYFGAAKAALSRANLMTTNNVVVLQALVFYLIAIRDIYRPRTVWTLTGLAIRVAEAMGISHDGAQLGLPPFEVEIRRRLWYLLKMHDFRIAELSGFTKFRGVCNDFLAVNMPANVDDKELHPKMTSPPVESKRPTQMIYCMVKAELGRWAATFAGQLRAQNMNHSSLDEHVSAQVIMKHGGVMEDMKDTLEMKYLRYCDPVEPLQLLTMIVSRSIIHIGYFMAHHPRRWPIDDTVSVSERAKVWDVSIKVLEQYELLYTSRQLQKFAWHQAYYIQWHILIHVLDTLRSEPQHTDAERAWKLVECLYENNLEMMLNPKRPMFVAVGNLCLKSYKLHETYLSNQGVNTLRPSKYIVKLREQRESAKAKEQSKVSKVIHRTINSSQATNLGTKPEPASSHPQPSQASNWNLQNSEMPPPGTNELINATDAITFWLNDNLNGGQFGQPSDHMNIATDLMLTDDFSVEDNAAFNMNWAQWDAWMGNPNGMQNGL